MQKITTYIESVRRMAHRRRPDPKMAQGVKDLSFLTVMVAVFMVDALHHYDSIHPLFLVGGVVTTWAVLDEWTRVVREIVKEMNAIANLIGDRT